MGIVVDLFAGGGGASQGILQALGRSPYLAVNHDEAAVLMHEANHPGTIHLCRSVYQVAPSVVGRRHIDLLWASPDCTHFSRAKGSAPRKREIRDLAWVVIEWAEARRPDVICIENVPEFVTWGPVDAEGQPIKERAGETFREFVNRLRLLGYRVEWRVLCAADYGAPTSRRRLFFIARRDQEAIHWPAPTHGPGRAPYHTAAECIDWDIPCPSIFDRTRTLAEATQRRIAEGIRRYVLQSPRPFVVVTGHQQHDGGKVKPITEPLGTVVTKAEHCLVSPSLVQLGYGERDGQAPRVLDLHAPLGTIVSGGGKHGLVAAFLARYHGERRDGETPRVDGLDEALPTITTENRFGLASVFLAKHYGGVVGQDLGRPIGTVTAKDHHSLAAVYLDKLYSRSVGAPLDAPAPTVTGHGHAALVAAFLTRYYGSGGQWSACNEPLPTVVSHDRFALVTVTIDGEPYVLADIGMRMLQPRELARAQGFPDSYVLTGTKAQQVARIGNSVPPAVVEAIVRAQFGGGSAARRAA